MSKAILFMTLCTSLMFAACQTNHTQLVGNGVDGKACLMNTGQIWSELKQQCVQIFNIADIELADPKNNTLAAYVILSDDKQQAELFWTSYEQKGIMLDVVKGGYLSKDNKVMLIKTADGWSIRER